MLICSLIGVGLYRMKQTGTFFSILITMLAIVCVIKGFAELRHVILTIASLFGGMWIGWMQKKGILKGW